MPPSALRRPQLVDAASAAWATDVSVCIPVGPGEGAWRALLDDLGPFGNAGGKAILCGPGDSPSGLAEWAEWIPADRPNRASQMNAVARTADGAMLWFLHADSRLDAGAIRSAVERGQRLGRAVGYLKLDFAADGPPLTRLNGWAANLRSRMLGMPFGDQGFFLSRELWEELGGFDEAAPYGEGHLFAWKARRAGAFLIELPATVTTSARKYQRRGWIRTTATHVWLTARQAAPQWWAWMRGR
ncbi:glycosyl transferase family 2 [Alienimonas chondri]|nr:glycosyl transferase family 2 [Alienimonas chondri]